MKILFISGWGCAVPLAMHMQESGHDIRFWIKDKGSEDVGDGFVPKVKDYEPSVSWADLVICDDTRFGKINDAIREKGIPVIGGTKMTDALEDDRGMGQRLFKSAGFTVLESKEFKTMEEAITYVQENPAPYVVKVYGKSQDDKTTTYVGESEEGLDVIAVLDRMKDKMAGKLEGVQVQERKEGLEVAVSGFFNGKEFVGPCQINFEHKKLMPGPTQAGSGPNTGEMGTTAVWYDQDCPLFKKILKPMIKPLAAMGYHGDFDINTIVVPGKAGEPIIYPLEMTNRFGWPALLMQIETLKENDLGEFFMAIASGQDFDLQPTHPVSLCVVIGVPPLPYTNDDIFEKFSKDMPILFKDGMAPEGLYPGEAKTEDDQWRVAGTKGMSGCAAVAAAGGYSIEECSDTVYSIADQVIVPNKFVRNDIGKFTDDALEELEEFGLIKEEEPSRL